MLRQIHRLVWLAVVTLACVGCDTPSKKPPEPLLMMPQEPEKLHRFYEPMIANAAASNMAVADGCFYPHTTELNSLGARRLDRMILNLERFGGTVRYETRSANKDMVASRIKSIESYLVDAGMDMTHVKVAPMMSGGVGVSAKQAIDAITKADKATQRSSTTKDEKKVERPD